MNPYKKKLISIRSKYFLIKALENLLLFLSIVVILFISTNFLINIFQKDYSTLKIIVLFFKSLSFLIFIFCIIRIIYNYHSLEYIAKKISNTYPGQNEVILSSLELERRKSIPIHQEYSDEIIDANIDLANKIADKIKFKEVFQNKLLFHLVKIFSLVFVIFLISFLINKNIFLKSFSAIIDIERFAPKYDSEIFVKPGTKILLKGSNQKIQIENFYPELTYTLNFEMNRRWKSVNLIKNYYTLYNIEDSLKYYVQNDFTRSDTFIITVLEKPTIKKLSVYYTYPKYSNLSDKVEEECSGNIIALKGTKIKLELYVNNNLQYYRIVFSDDRIIKLKKINDFQYSVNFIIEKSISYHFYLEDILQNKNQPIERTIYAEEDFSPKIEITFPAEDKILAQNLQEDIGFIASDDFGISELQIAFKNNNEEYTYRPIKTDINETNLKGTYTFDISDQNLLPGDVICYYLIVYDNCSIPERQNSKSRIYLLKFPSIEELYEEIQKEQSDKYQDLAKNLEENLKTKEKFDELRRKFLKTEEFDWEEKEDLKSILKKQEKFAEKAEQIAEDYKKFIDQIEKNKVVSSETLEKLKQIQEIMEEISTPELKETMKKLQDAMQKITPEQMKKALDNFQFSQEEFLKQLEETLKLLESIKLEQDMQKCLQQAEELEKLQEELNKKTDEKIDQNENLNELANEQEDISDKYDSLKKNLEELIEELKKNQESKAAQELQKALEQTEQDNLSDNLDQAMQKLKANNSQNLSSKQNKIKKSFSQLKQSIQFAQGMMQSAMQEQFQALIEKTLFDLIYFSEKQEKILDSKYTAYDILDIEVAMYEGIKNTINQLYSMPLIMLMITPKFPSHTAETLNIFEQLFDQIKDRRNYNAQKDKQDIYVSINRMIIDLLQSQQQMPQCGGGGMQQLLQQLQQMSQGQNSINLLTQALFEQMLQQGQGLTPEQRSMLSRIAANEQEIKDNLERILKEFPEAEKLMGNLDNVKDELKEVLKKLEKGIIDNELIEQQQRILSRLLDAQRSIHRRDFSKKRESRIPEEKEYQTPDSLKIDINYIQIRDILKFINENYPEEYHRLIKEYLERIQKEGTE